MNDETPLSEPSLDGVEMESPIEAAPVDERDVEIGVLKEEAAALKDRLLRMAAEMENLRKRTEREKAEATLYAASNFARDLLSVADNLGRALQALPEEERDRAGEAEKNLSARRCSVISDCLSWVSSFWSWVLRSSSKIFSSNSPLRTLRPSGKLMRTIRPVASGCSSVFSAGTRVPLAVTSSLSTEGFAT